MQHRDEHLSFSDRSSSGLPRDRRTGFGRARRWLALLGLPCLAVFGCASSQPAASSPAATNSAASNPADSPAAATADGWENLLPAASLEGYERVPLDPLAAKQVWQVRADGSLFIDGQGAKEMLLADREFGDGALHVEWRFIQQSAAPGAAAPVYNGGVYVRTAMDGKSYVQLQVAQADKPPVVGDLIAQVPGRAERVDVFQEQPSASAPVGEWNTYDITLHGSKIELSVNGKPSVTWPDCPMLAGHLGLQAEGAPIEVRAFRFKPL